MTNNKLIKILMNIFGISAVSFAAICIGSAKWIKVNNRKVYIKNLKDSLENFKILQISDLHSNNENKINLNIWKHIFKLDFDMVVITGDIVNSSIYEIEPHLKYIEELSKKCPVYLVEGNHEMYDNDELTSIMKNIGVKVLNNKKVTLQYKDCNIDIIGFRNIYSLKVNNYKPIKKVFEHYKKNDILIILEHQPQLFDMLKKYEPDIMLSGHTHGGQIRLPFMPTLIAPDQGFFPKYGEGLYYHKNSKLYVSRGLGHTDFPIRFFNRPELVIFELLNKKK